MILIIGKQLQGDTLVLFTFAGLQWLETLWALGANAAAAWLIDGGKGGGHHKSVVSLHCLSAHVQDIFKHIK